VADTINFGIREVLEGLYAIDGIFRDEIDYFAPSPLYQKSHQPQAKPPVGENPPRVKARRQSENR